MMTIRQFGAFITITVTSMRKFVTLFLSFLIFPKPLTVHYFIAIAVVALGISLHIYAKNATVLDNLVEQVKAKIPFVRNMQAPLLFGSTFRKAV